MVRGEKIFRRDDHAAQAIPAGMEFLAGAAENMGNVAGIMMGNLLMLATTAGIFALSVAVVRNVRAQLARVPVRKEQIRRR
jgi:hypothetical protein